MARIYVIGKTSDFTPKFEEFQSGTGFYFDAGFDNMGAIRASNDGVWTLLEEDESKFDPVDLALPDVTIFRDDAEMTAGEICKAYINFPLRRDNWISEDLI